MNIKKTRQTRYSHYPDFVQNVIVLIMLICISVMMEILLPTESILPRKVIAVTQNSFVLQYDNNEKEINIEESKVKTDDDFDSYDAKIVNNYTTNISSTRFSKKVFKKSLDKNPKMPYNEITMREQDSPIGNPFL